MSYIEKMFELSEKIVVVTGGLGQLGRQYAKSLRLAGARVAIFDIKHCDELFPANASFQLADNGFGFYEVDVTKRDSIQKATDSVVKDFGIPNVLINNAAIDAPPGSNLGNCSFEDYPEEALDAMIDVNEKGTFFCCQVIGGLMAKNKGGSIINISSIYGNVSPDQRIYEHLEKDGKKFYKPASYCMTKSAILNLTRYLATYWRNVRVNTLSLGGVFNNQDRRFLEKYLEKVPLRRMAYPEDYVAMILYLASDSSLYTNGANLTIDGGYTAL